MVTLITKKLQGQRLDDLAHKSYDTGPCSAQKLTKGGHPFPFETGKEEHPREVVGGGRPDGSQVAVGPASPAPPGPRGPGVGALSARDLGGSAGPPTQRHGRSLSEPEELARGGCPRRAGGPGLRPQQRERRAAGPRPLGRRRRLGPCALAGLGQRQPPGRGPGQATGGGPHALPATPPVAAARAPGAGGRGPTAGRQRARAHARVHARAWPPSGPAPPPLAAARARGREGPAEARARPALDFLKMARTLKTSKSFCPLDYEDEDEEDDRVRMALSSLRDPRGPATRGPGLRPTSPDLGSWWGWATGEGAGGSGGDPGDWDSAGEEGVLPPGPGELDLEQMESS